MACAARCASPISKRGTGRVSRRSSPTWRGSTSSRWKLERLEEAHRRSIRHVQLVHYTPNDIGDFQTGAITHQGLTEFGAEVIRACDRLGFVCDVAHATDDMAKRAVKVATKPLLLSHTAVLGSRAMGPTPLGVGR